MNCFSPEPVLIDDFGAGDVAGHQIGRELDAAERHLQGLRQRGNEKRFGQARHAHKKRVTPRENGDEDLLHNIGLTYNDFRDLKLNIGIGGLAEIDRFNLVGCRGFSRG